jgi:hypothetical protein
VLAWVARWVSSQARQAGHRSGRSSAEAGSVHLACSPRAASDARRPTRGKPRPAEGVGPKLEALSETAAVFRSGLLGKNRAACRGAPGNCELFVLVENKHRVRLRRSRVFEIVDNSRIYEPAAFIRRFGAAPDRPGFCLGNAASGERVKDRSSLLRLPLRTRHGFRVYRRLGASVLPRR